MDLDTIVSWNFWSHYFEKHPDKLSKLLPGYTWPGNSNSFWEAVKRAGKDYCPGCHGHQIKAVEGQAPVNGFEIDRVYCVCALANLISLPDPFESSYRFTKLSELKAWDNPPGAGKHTQEIIQEAVRFIKYPGEWLYIYGTYGCGKTHILNAVKTAMGGAALYLTMADLNEQVFKEVRNNNLDGLLDTIASSPILLLDDIGSEYPTEFFYSSLYTIVNRRYSQGRKAPTFISSNMTTDQLLGSSVENLRRIGDRLSDVDLVTPLVSKQASWRRRDA